MKRETWEKNQICMDVIINTAKGTAAELKEAAADREEERHRLRGISSARGRRSATEAGEALRAEDLPQEAENTPQEATEAAGEAAEAVPWYGDTPAEQEKQRQELEALRRERKRLYDAERYRRRKEAETPEEAAAARRAKSAYDAERYRKRKAAAAPPPPERA